jgi:very-short-patch-repair endonuclease
MGCTYTSSFDRRNLNPALLANLMRQLSDKIYEFTPQTLTNLLWSFVALDVPLADIRKVLIPIFGKLFLAVKCDKELSCFNNIAINQLADFFAYYEREFPDNWTGTLNDIITAVNARFGKLPKPVSSYLHKRIVRVLAKNCDNPFKCEFQIGGGFADICFPTEKVVFEVNGNNCHYGPDGQLNVHSQIRQRIMQKRGYQVFNIKESDWEEATDKDSFLRQLIVGAGLRAKPQVKAPSLPVPLTMFLPMPTVAVIAVSVIVWQPVRANPASSKRTCSQTDFGNSDDEPSIFKLARFDK